MHFVTEKRQLPSSIAVLQLTLLAAFEKAVKVCTMDTAGTVKHETFALQETFNIFAAT